MSPGRPLSFVTAPVVPGASSGISRISCPRKSSLSGTAKPTGTASSASRATLTFRLRQPASCKQRTRAASLQERRTAPGSTRSIPAICSALSKPPNPSRCARLAAELERGLRERSYGAFQGHDSDEIARSIPTNTRTGKPAIRTSRRPTANRSEHSHTGAGRRRADRRRASGRADCRCRARRRAGLRLPVRARLAARRATRLAVAEFQHQRGGLRERQTKIVSWGDVSHLRPRQRRRPQGSPALEQIRLHRRAAPGSLRHAVVQRPADHRRDHLDARPRPRAT